MTLSAWGALFLLVLLSARTAPPEIARQASPPAITPLPPRREPFWLRVMFPKPGANVLLDQYQDPNFNRWDGYGVTFGRAPDTICFDVHANSLIAPGDFWDVEDVIAHTQVLVDGELRNVVPETVEAIALGFFLGPPPVIAIPSPTFIKGFGTPISVGSAGPAQPWVKPRGSVGGPYGWCVSAPLAAGVHQAEVSFTKSSGESFSFAWTFTLVEGSLPTQTPLPTPASIDRTGNLPSYLRLAFPEPGRSVSQAQALADWQKFLRTAINNGYRADDPTVLPVCVALKMPDLEQMGALPIVENERIYIQVDGTLLTWNPYAWYPYLDSSTRTQCVELKQPTAGEHIATLYIDFFDSPIRVYSWAFTVAQAPAIGPDCQAPFQKVIDHTVPGLDESAITQELVEAGEFYVNHCVTPDIPLSDQPERLAELRRLAEVVPPAFDCAARYTPTTELGDFDGDGVDELVLHTQAMRCDINAVFGFLGGGGLSIVYRRDTHRQTWSGTLIWPCFESSCSERGVWTHSPRPTVQSLPVQDSQGRKFMLVAGGYLGGDHTAVYLNFWRWEKAGNPQIVLTLQLTDWCGLPNSWEVTAEGGIIIPAAPATDRCPNKRDAILYVLRNNEFEAVRP